MATLGTTRHAVRGGARPRAGRKSIDNRRRATPTAEPLARRVAAHGSAWTSAAAAPRSASARRRRVQENPVSLPGRALAACAIIALLYGGLAARLYYLQVHRHAEFAEEAKQLRWREIRYDAPRGSILDRSGVLLVQNEPAATIVVDPNMWAVETSDGDGFEDRRARTIQELKALLPDVDVEGIVSKRLALGRAAKGRFYTADVARVVPVEVARKIEAADLPGVGILPASRRRAINGDLASHVVGFTGRDGDGLAGLERILNEPLAGEDGVLAAEIDRTGQPVPGTVAMDREVEPGRDVVLTLDARIQHVAEGALRKAFASSKAESATAIVLDPKTGDVLALANCPTYNVNRRGEAPVAARVNQAVSVPFEPGSTLKVMTVAAAMQEGLYTADSTFYCTGRKQIGRRTIHCAHGDVHGNETLLDVIRNSCNIATADCAFKLGKQKLYEYERQFGFGDKTNVGLPGESRGILAPPGEWSDIQLSNIAFGQGISVTPLQLASAYSAIANDGLYRAPRIIRGTRDPETGTLRPDPVVDGKQVVSAQVARDMRRMLQSVVDDGTGKLAQLDGYTAGGKTGTAQIAGKGGYTGKYVASFVGMAPAKDPELVILVAVTAPKGGYYGGVVAGPVFKEIAEKSLLLRRVPRDRPETVGKKAGRRGSVRSFAD